MTSRSKTQRDYQRYLKTPAWRSIRARVIFRDGRRCQLCGQGGKGLEAHHLTYARLGHEDLNDLITLCPACHAAVHQHQPRPGAFNHG